MTIGGSAFRSSASLVSVKIPKSVTSIGLYAFRACASLNDMVIPENANSIGANAFQGCESIQSVTIPDTVSSIGNEAFLDCKSLKTVYVNRSIREGLITGGSYMFTGCDPNLKIYVPADSTKTYQAMEYWEVYASQILAK